MPRFLTYSAIGSGLWTTLLATAGYVLRDRHEGVTRYVGPLATTVVAGVIAIYLWRLVRFEPHP